MGYTAEELQAIRTAVGSIAADRIQRAGLYDPAGYSATALARYLAEHAEEWIDFAHPKPPEALDGVVARFIAAERNRPKPKRRERHLLEQLAAERSGYPPALRAALMLIRVETGLSPTPRTVGLYSVFQSPGLYSVHWMDQQKTHHSLETRLPLSSADFSRWKHWRDSPAGRR